MYKNTLNIKLGQTVIYEWKDLEEIFDTLQKITYYRKNDGVYYIEIDWKAYNEMWYTREQIMNIIAGEILKEKNKAS